MHLYFRCCEKESTISYVERFNNLSKKVILRKSWASLKDQLTPEDKVTFIQDEVSEDTLNWLDKTCSATKEFIAVPAHDFSNHLHTIVLVDELRKNIKLEPTSTHFLIEDDYLFSSNALTHIRSLERVYEGFFVPYDYPDRYKEKKLAQIMLGLTCHWRTITSCTMTIGASAKLWDLVIEDLAEAAPTSNDQVFEKLFKKYACISPIPGVASHLTAHHHTPYFPVVKRFEELEIL